MLFIDPYGIDDARKNDYLEKWKAYYNNRIDKRIENWNLMDIQHPLQDDAYNCGPWCCYFLQEILEEGCIDLINNFSIDKFREEMGNVISTFKN